MFLKSKIYYLFVTKFKNIVCIIIGRGRWDDQCYIIIIISVTQYKTVTTFPLILFPDDLNKMSGGGYTIAPFGIR